MNVREIKELLSRAKLSASRNDYQKAIAAVYTALRKLGQNSLPMDLRSILRETIQILARNENVTCHIQTQLIYQPGQETTLLANIARIYKGITQETEEESSVALERKLKLDRTFNQAIKFLAQNRVSDADTLFTECLKYYKDEHAIFSMIGKALLDAQEIRRAYPYLKRGIDAAPNNEHIQKLFAECERLRAQL